MTRPTERPRADKPQTGDPCANRAEGKMHRKNIRNKKARLSFPARRRLLTSRIYLLTLQAVINAVLIGFIAKGMVLLIDFCTNIAFNFKFSFSPAAPSLDKVGYFVFVIPILGALIVGLMARYGSPNIRGHGFPETIERILAFKSRISPKLVVLKPLSAAISIGTGGPFGAEGPIIATGGAFGSFVGQLMVISDNERKILLTAGSCAGVAAIFGSPVAGILMAVELLLFEYSPRAIVPVALSCATAATMHILLFGKEAVFAMPDIPEPGYQALIIYVLLGFALGVSGAYASRAVYAIEDFFAKYLKGVHWMWWPAMGAVVVAIIGYFAPLTMGVGYDNIRNLLSGQVALYSIIALSFLKFISWAVYLGSGTSGSTMAPLFTIGGALGALFGYVILHLFPAADINMATCALIGMAATFTGATRAILTSIVFAFETTLQAHGLLPLIGACTSAYLISFFLMKGGTLYTEKVERMGIRTPAVLEADILQQLTVKDVLEPEANVLSANNSIAETRNWIRQNTGESESAEFVVINGSGTVLGMVSRKAIFALNADKNASVLSIVNPEVPAVYQDYELSAAIDLMDEYQTDLLPVISRNKNKKLIGVLTHKAIFAAYHRRRYEANIQSRKIFFPPQGIHIISRGRKLFRWNRDYDDHPASPPNRDESH